MNHSQKSLHVNYSNKQTKVLFTLSFSHRDTLCILDLQEMHSVHFLVNSFPNWFANLCCLLQCLQAGGVLVPCLCSFIAVSWYITNTCQLEHWNYWQECYVTHVYVPSCSKTPHRTFSSFVDVGSWIYSRNVFACLSLTTLLILYVRKLKPR